MKKSMEPASGGLANEKSQVQPSIEWQEQGASIIYATHQFLNQINTPPKKLTVQQLTLQNQTEILQKPLHAGNLESKNSTKIHTPEFTNTSNQTHVKSIT